MNRLQEQPIHFERPVKSITVNGIAIDQTELAQEMQLHNAENFNQARQRAGQALVIRQLLREQVQEQLNDGNDEETAIAELIANKVPDVSVDDEACSRFYRQNPTHFQSAPLIVVRHILFAVAKEDLIGRAEQKAQAEKLLNQLKNSDNVLSEFVANVEQSRCPSKEDDGLLGELSSGQTVPEFERQVFMLDEGLATNLIETRYGYHLVYIDKKQEGKPLPLDVCMDRIRDYLNQRRQRQAVSDYLHQLTEKAQISGIQLQMEQENIVL